MQCGPVARTRRGTSVIGLAAALALLIPSPVGAVEKCKVAIDARTGTLHVSASSVTGTLRWGATPDTVTHVFFDAATCLVGGKARKCSLADPATVDAKTPPPGCTLHLADEAPSTCNVWIKGCTPGSRVFNGAPGCPRIVDGIAIFDSCP